jgi:hypothetical protein
VSRSAPKPRRSSLLPFYIVLGVVAVAGSFLLYRQVSGSGGTAATTLSPVVMTPEQLNRVPGIPQGSPDAPVVIMEFADFQCGACADFAMFYKPLVADHIQDGRALRLVRLAHRADPRERLPRGALRALRATSRTASGLTTTWCSGSRQSGAETQLADDGSSSTMRRSAGLDRDAFAQCLVRPLPGRGFTQNTRWANVMGVSGTPTLFVNGKRLQQIPTRRADWDALVEREMGTAAAAPAPEAGAGE